MHFPSKAVTTFTLCGVLLLAACSTGGSPKPNGTVSRSPVTVSGIDGCKIIPLAQIRTVTGNQNIWFMTKDNRKTTDVNKAVRRQMGINQVDGYDSCLYTGPDVNSVKSTFFVGVKPIKKKTDFERIRELQYPASNPARKAQTVIVRGASIAFAGRSVDYPKYIDDIEFLSLSGNYACVIAWGSKPPQVMKLAEVAASSINAAEWGASGK